MYFIFVELAAIKCSTESVEESFWLKAQNTLEWKEYLMHNLHFLYFHISFYSLLLIYWNFGEKCPRDSSTSHFHKNSSLKWPSSFEIYRNESVELWGFSSLYSSESTSMNSWDIEWWENEGGRREGERGIDRACIYVCIYIHMCILLEFQEYLLCRILEVNSCVLHES